MAESASVSSPARPRVAVLYTPASSASREGELSAKFLGLCLAASGHCEKVFVVGVDPLAEKNASANGVTATTARRSDGVEIAAAALGSALYEEVHSPLVLAQCHVWLLLLDADVTASSVQFLLKRCVCEYVRVKVRGELIVCCRAGGYSVKKSDAKQPKRVIVSLQTTLRQLNPLDKAYVQTRDCPHSACLRSLLSVYAVVRQLCGLHCAARRFGLPGSRRRRHGRPHGPRSALPRLLLPRAASVRVAGRLIHPALACMNVKSRELTNDEGVLCVYIRRSEKVEALFVLDMLEASGLQVLSRRNIQGALEVLTGSLSVVRGL